VVGIHRRIGISTLGESDFSRSREPGHRKSQNPYIIGTVQLERMRGNHLAPPGEARQEGVIGNWDIGDSGSKGFMHFIITKCDFLIRHRSTWAIQESVEDRWQIFATGERTVDRSTTVSRRGIRDRRIASPKGACTLTSQAPKSRWEVVRLRSYGKWSHLP
jgi:hypothetical protein